MNARRVSIRAHAPTNGAPLLDVDWSAFDPWRIQPVRHGLSEHPLLQPAALAELGARLEARRSTRTHASDATAGTPFNDAPRLHPNTRSVSETLRAIDGANAWMSLLNVQSDPDYRNLVGTVLDGIQPQIEMHDPGMCHRAGWIFVSSPRTVTPFHFDKEHNFILQMCGHKRVYVWDHRDTAVASEHARDRFHHLHDRDLLRWSEEFRARARVFDLGPGQGAYMPSTSPHMVENGDGPSITMSFTYYTDSTCRDSRLHKMHALMRRSGMVPPAVGRSPVFDALCHAGIVAVLRTRGAARRLARAQGTAAYSRFSEATP